MKAKKNKIRNFIRSLKKSYTVNELTQMSEQVVEHLEHLDSFQDAKNILAYWSLEDEVYTHSLILKYYTHKRILLPVIDGVNLKTKEFTGLKSLQKEAKYGILEPNGPDFNAWDEIDIILVPGMAFDHRKNRLGRGKAFYDRFLKEISAPKYGLAFDFQMLNAIPTEATDIPMDGIINQTGIL